MATLLQMSFEMLFSVIAAVIIAFVIVITFFSQKKIKGSTMFFLILISVLLIFVNPSRVLKVFSWGVPILLIVTVIGAMTMLIFGLLAGKGMDGPLKGLKPVVTVTFLIIFVVAVLGGVLEKLYYLQNTTISVLGMSFDLLSMPVLSTVFLFVFCSVCFAAVLRMI